ncbi:hypothetical protein WS68_01410 [Burkholderia sp. TSV86]|nr:hypothetical protein WS68_01410 [Burkholderia sp. TSV86]
MFVFRGVGLIRVKISDRARPANRGVMHGAALPRTGRAGCGRTLCRAVRRHAAVRRTPPPALRRIARRPAQIQAGGPNARGRHRPRAAVEIRANGHADTRGDRLDIRSRQNRGFAPPGSDGREAGAGRT